MKDEITLRMQKARKLLDLAQHLIRHGYSNDAARDSYLAAYHAAQALIITRTGHAAKTYESAHSQFAPLTLNEPLFDAPMKKFLPDAYAIKNLAEYGLGDDAVIAPERAAETVAKAALFIERITYVLTHPPNPQRERSDASTL